MSVTTSTTVRAVTVSFWLYIAAAIANALVGLSALLRIGSVTSAVQRVQAQHPTANVPTGTLQAAALGGLVFVVVIAVVWSVLVVVFAVQMRRGRNWARIVVTVLGALSLFGVLGFGAIVFVLAAVAIVFSFLPTANAYFRPIGSSTWG